MGFRTLVGRRVQPWIGSPAKQGGIHFRGLGRAPRAIKLKPNGRMAVHGRDGHFPALEFTEIAQQVVKICARMVATDAPIRQSKHAVKPERPFAGFIACAVTLVVLKEQIADYDKATGSQNPDNFRDNLRLTFNGRSGRENGEEESSVERCIRERQLAAAVDPQIESRCFPLSPPDHFRRRINANDTRESARLELDAQSPVAATHVQNGAVSPDALFEQGHVERVTKRLFARHAVPIVRLLQRYRHSLKFHRAILGGRRDARIGSFLAIIGLARLRW